MIMLGGAGTDSQLLDSYVRGQDPAAFQELVSRHGAVVHRVCRGVLKDIHEAEDAFQATFLVLVRKAPEIRDPEALAGWLRGVAYRVATRARRRAARRREMEKARAEIENSRDKSLAPREQRASDLKELIGGELSRLPEDYRQPIVLCYLDGLTHQEAARRLGWPVGTVKVRLVRGRRMLRDRLSRRDVALGAGLLILLPASRRACAVTEPLVESTIRAMSLAAAGAGAALKSEYPRACELAEEAGRCGLIPGPGWLLAALVVAAVSLALKVPVCLALGGPPVSEADPSTLPSNLTNVLNVECR